MAFGAIGDYGDGAALFTARSSTEIKLYIFSSGNSGV
jgi:hypothetical protein